MAGTIVINKLTAVHSGSGGVSVAFPDVCLTRIGKDWVPIPYPNTARAADTARASRTVKGEGRPLMLKSSCFSRSTGDEPGRKGGVVSGKTKGKAYPRSFSMDVKIEGQNALRNTDLMLQNGGSPTNTPPAPVMQPNGGARGKKAKGTVAITSLSWDKASVFCGDEVEARAQARDARDGPFPFRVWRAAGNLLQKVLAARLKANQASAKWKVQRGPAAAAVQLELRHENPDGQKVKSGPLEVKGIPAVAKATVGPVNRVTPQWVYNTNIRAWAPTGANYQWQYYYTIEIAGGEVRVHRPVEFAPQAGLAAGHPTAAQRRAWKRQVEAVWDGKFLFHRKDCRRGRRCGCQSSRSCCKLRLRVQVEFGASGVAGLEKVKLFPGACDRRGWGQPDKWWYSNTWWEKTDNVGNPSGVRAHEFGHLIGMYDEYPAGACDPGRVHTDEKKSIMSTGKRAFPRHVADFLAWAQGKMPGGFGNVETIP